MLLRVVVGEFRRVFLRATVLMLVLASLASVIGGGLAAPASLVQTRDDIYQQLRHGDLHVQLAAPNWKRGPLKQLADLPSVAGVHARFIANGFLENDNGQPFPVVIIFIDPRTRPVVDDLRIQSGEFLSPGKPADVVVDRSFAEHQSVSLQDIFAVRVAGRLIRFRARGIGYSPQFLVPTANPNLLAPPKGSLGIVYASSELINRRFARDLTGRLKLFGNVLRTSLRPYNNIAIQFSPGVDKTAATKACMKVLSPIGIKGAITQENAASHVYLEEELTGFYVFVPVCAFIMGAVAVLVSSVAINRMLRARLPEIASLSALGFTPLQILVGMTCVMLVPAVIALCLAPLGAHYFAVLLVRTYEQLVGVPETQITHPWWTWVAAILAPLVVTLLAAALPILRVRNVQPVALLRCAGEVSFRGLPTWLDTLCRPFSPAMRFALRNLMRRPQVTVPTILAIALTIAMPASFLTTSSSWLSWTKQIANDLEFDAVITLREPTSQSDARQFLNVKPIATYKPFLVGGASIQRSNAAAKQTRLIGLTTSSSLRKLSLVSGSSFTADDAPEIVLNRNFRGDAPMPRLGEQVTVTAAEQSHLLTVVGIVSDPSFGIAYCPLKTLQTILQLEGMSTGYTIQQSAESNISELRAHMLAWPQVETFKTQQEIASSMLDYVTSYRSITRPIVAVSLILALLFLITVMGVLLAERDMEYAVLRSLGNDWRTIAPGVILELVVLALTAVIVAIPCWIAMGLVLRVAIGVTYVDPGLALLPTDFAYVALAAVAVLMLTSIFSITHIMRVPLPIVLRHRSFG